MALTLEQRLKRYSIIREIEQNNRLKRARKKQNIMVQATIRTLHIESGFPVEITVDDTVDQIGQFCKALNLLGFKPIVYQSKTDKPDIAGKTGTVKSITKKEGKNQWDVIITIDGEGAGEARIVAFAATAFRKGDKVRLSKNEKGYLEAALLSDEEEDNPTNDKLAF